MVLLPAQVQLCDLMRLCLCAVCEGEGVAKHVTEAVRLWRLAVNQGHAKAQYELGRCHT